MKRSFTKYPSNYVKANVDLPTAFKLGRRKNQLYVAELDNGTLILIDAGPKGVTGLDYVGGKIVGHYGWDNEHPNATDNFVNGGRLKGAKRITPYANEIAALEGETGVPFECIHIDCPKDRWLYKDNNGNILTPRGLNDTTRDYNLFSNYSFDDIVDLVIAADSSPDHTAENINHGFGHNKMICTISE